MEVIGTQKWAAHAVLGSENERGKIQQQFIRRVIAEPQKVTHFLSFSCFGFISLQNSTEMLLAMDHSLITAASNCICWKNLSRFDHIFHFPFCMCFGSSWKAPALNIMCWLEFKTQEQFRPLEVFAFFPLVLSDSHSENKLSVTWVYVTRYIIKVRLSFCSVLKRIVNNYIHI